MHAAIHALAVISIGALSLTALGQSNSATDVRYQNGPTISLREAVLTEREAVVLLPPVAIGNDIAVAQWSPSGRYVLMLQTGRLGAAELSRLISAPPTAPPVTKQAKVQMYSRVSGKTSDLLTVDVNRLYDWEWFATGDVALTVLTGTVASPQGNQGGQVPIQFVWYDMAAGTARTFSGPASGDVMAVDTAPSGNLAFIQVFEPNQPKGQVFAFVVDSSGRLVNRLAFSTDVMIRWSEDGRSLVETTRGNRGIVHTLVNPLTGARMGGAVPPRPPAAPAKADVEVEQDSLTLHRGEDTDPVTCLFLRAVGAKEPARTLVSTHASLGLLAPKADAILYRHMQVAMVRELLRMPKEKFKDMLAAQRRSDVMMRAKQIGLALIMYAADHDDVLPGPDGWEKKVAPYLKDSKMLAGFTYSFAGGNMENVARPAETELGSFELPGGERIVVYVDGHVRSVRP